MMRKSVIYTLFVCSLFLFNIGFSSAAVQTPVKPAVKVQTPAVSYLNVSPIDVVNNASKYLNKNISFTGELVSFTSLGLDYKPAYKDPVEYVGMLVKRPDVSDYTIPLSEMKMFIKRDMLDKGNANSIESGDRVKFFGKVFSTALGDPWVEVSSFEIVEKKEKKEK